jgi:hypothetical protein
MKYETHYEYICFRDRHGDSYEAQVRRREGEPSVCLLHFVMRNERQRKTIVCDTVGAAKDWLSKNVRCVDTEGLERWAIGEQRDVMAFDAIFVEVVPVIKEVDSE